MKKLALLLALLASPAFAQSVQQSGSVTPGHAAMWTTNGVVQDAGTAANGFLTSLGVQNNGGPGICINSAPITGAYNELCFAVSTAAAAQVSLQNFGGAAAQGLNFVINGTTYTIPGSLAGITINTTAVTGGSNAQCLFINSGTVGAQACSAATTITVGSTTIASGSANAILYNNAGTLGNITTANGGFVNTNGSGVPSVTATPTLGVAGSTAGTLSFANTTSGTVKLQTVNGALGAVTASLPANTGTIAELNLAQTWSAVQTFSANDFVIAGSSSGSLTVNCAAACGSNTLTLPAGTTDFSATGGTSQVVKQTSSGGAFTVAQLAFSDVSGQASLAQLPSMGSYTVLTNKTGGTATPTASSTLWLGGAPGEAGAADIFLVTGTITADSSGAIKAGGIFNAAQTYIAGMFVEPSFGASLAGTTFYGISINDAFTAVGYTLTNQVGLRINKPTKGGTTNIPLWLNGNSCCLTNTVPSPSPPSSATPYIFITPADGTGGSLVFDGYGTFAAPTFQTRHSRGTQAAPVTLSAADLMFQMAISGYDGVAFSNPAAGIFFNAFNNWTGGDHSTYMTFNTTPSGSITNTEAARVQASGGFSIGATTDPGTGGLFVNGATITLNGLATDATHTDRTVCQDTTSKSLFFGSGAAGICLGTSSEEFKHGIVPLPVGLAQILKMRPVEYYLNADHGDPDHLLYGFTAQREEDNLPMLVGRDAEGRPSSFDYMGVVPVLVKAIQELQQEVMRLKNR